MSELHAFDSASPWDEARLTAIKNKHNGVAVSVYIRGTPGGFRHASAADVNLARRIGLGVLPNWESTADFFAHCSITEAKAAGVEARESAKALGFPDDGTITLPFSFDYQVPAAGFRAALDRLNACQDGLTDAYRASSYGQSSLIAYFGHNGYGDRGHWLMASTWGLPDYDIGSPFVAAVQSHHADGSWFASPVPGTDASTITQPDKLGAWWPDNSPFGADMPVTDADVQKIVQAVKQAVIQPAAGGQPAETIASDLRDVHDKVAALQKQVAALQAVVSTIKTGSVDVPALATQLAAHLAVQVVAK